MMYEMNGVQAKGTKPKATGRKRPCMATATRLVRGTSQDQPLFTTGSSEFSGFANNTNMPLSTTSLSMLPRKRDCVGTKCMTISHSFPLTKRMAIFSFANSIALRLQHLLSLSDHTTGDQLWSSERNELV